MKVLVYVNKLKDKNNKILENLLDCLKSYNVEYLIVDDNLRVINENYTALFVIGGDGTILRRTDFAISNNLPIIGINAGKLGFLTEFEPNEIENAVSLLINNQLKRDVRSTLSLNVNGKNYIALNDVVIQRIYDEESAMTISLDVFIDGDKSDTITGDGVIVATPTGSTAYSLSAGGAILAPGINAFSITPLAAHSYSQRAVVYSSSSICEIKMLSGNAGLFVDGKLVSNINKVNQISISKHDKNVVFLRKKDTSFFKRLTFKIKNKSDGSLWKKMIENQQL